ncbi:MAG: hypothetical protein WC447_01540 [Candidatus Paceibacterota bacterium]|jgi:hypothetical protein
MQDKKETKKELNPKLLDLSPEDSRDLGSFFTLLIKIDKRVNPANYQLNKKEYD